MSAAGRADALLQGQDYARLAIILCLPQIVSTAILAILGAVPDSAYGVAAISLLSVSALPAFMVAAYAGPLLLVVSGPVVARAVRSHHATQAVVALTALLLGLLSFALFELVVIWWDLPLP